MSTDSDSADTKFYGLYQGVVTLNTDPMLRGRLQLIDRKSTRLNSSHERLSRMPSSA